MEQKKTCLASYFCLKNSGFEISTISDHMIFLQYYFPKFSQMHTGKIRDILDVSLSKQTLSKMQRIIMILWINRSPMQMKNFGTKFSWKSLIDIAAFCGKVKAFFPMLPRVCYQIRPRDAMVRLPDQTNVPLAGAPWAGLGDVGYPIMMTDSKTDMEPLPEWSWMLKYILGAPRSKIYIE